jgi:hypothetical protein
MTTISYPTDEVEPSDGQPEGSSRIKHGLRRLARLGLDGLDAEHRLTVGDLRQALATPDGVTEALRERAVQSLVPLGVPGALRRGVGGSGRTTGPSADSD